MVSFGQVIILAHHPKYIDRLATVYLEKYHQFGYDIAVMWYKGFIPEQLQDTVREVISQKVEANKPKEPKA